MNEKRIDYWDNLKGLLILLVVIGHFFYDLRINIAISDIAIVIFVFIIPTFVFVSGFFSKENVNWNRLKKLFIFYLIGNTFIMWISYAFFGTKMNLLEPYYLFWYLLALIIWRISFNKLVNIKYILPLSIIIAILIGSFQEINNTLALSKIICFFPFFILGYKIKDNKYYEMLKNKNLLKAFFALFSLACIILITIFFIPHITFDDLLMNPYINFENIINRLIIFVLAFFIILFLLIVTPKNKIIFLNKIGRNSLYIFIFHTVFVLMFISYWKYASDTIITICSTIIISILICIIFGSETVKNITDNCYEKILEITTDMRLTHMRKVLTYSIVFFIVITLIVPIFDIEGDENLYSIKLNDNSKIVNLIEDSDSICFIGDSVTAGGRIGGHGWYEPLISPFKDKKITNVSLGGATAKTILNKTSTIDKPSDLYVIAIGTNDIGLRNPEICSMDEKEFIDNMNNIVCSVPKNGNTEFAIIAPWPSLENSNSKLNTTEKQEDIQKYSLALKEYCDSKGYLFINPNDMIMNTLEKEQPNKYLIDYIHPSYKEGLELYSKAVMESSTKKMEFL